jgi:uncharacterized protein YceH (UPF0502 family)
MDMSYPMRKCAFSDACSKRDGDSDYYPLSLVGLVNACNQKTNRDPVVAYNKQTMPQALGGLRQKRMAWQATLTGCRSMHRI